METAWSTKGGGGGRGSKSKRRRKTSLLLSLLLGNVDGALLLLDRVQQDAVVLGHEPIACWMWNGLKKRLSVHTHLGITDYYYYASVEKVLPHLVWEHLLSLIPSYCVVIWDMEPTFRCECKTTSKYSITHGFSLHQSSVTSKLILETRDNRHTVDFLFSEIQGTKEK